MSHYISFLRLTFSIAVITVIHSCGDGGGQSVNHASSPEELSQKTNALIADILKSGATADADSGFRLEQAELVKLIYTQNNNQAIWAAGQQWKTGADSLQAIIQSARLLGLFPEDYHATALGSIWQEMVMDSLAKYAKRDAMLWAKADLMLTDAFAQLVHDIKLGKLPNDSISLNKDTVINTSWLLPELNKLKETRNYELGNQLDSAAGSIMDNIAEGFEREGNKEFIQFLAIAKGSLAEVRSQLYRVKDRELVKKEEFEELQQKCLLLAGKLGAFISYLRNSDFKGNKFKEKDKK